MTGAHIQTSRTRGGDVLVEVRGEIDIDSATRLRDTLVEMATLYMPAWVVVDLLHVTFIDSTGLGALAAGRNAAQRLGVGFTVRHPSPFVVSQLRQTGLYNSLVVDR